MLLEFTCTQCGKELSVSGTLAGKKIKCPSCEAVLTVPQATKEETYDVAEPSPATAKSVRGRQKQPNGAVDYSGEERRPPSRHKLSRSMLNLLMALGGALVLGSCCLGCAGAGWLYFFTFPGSELVGTWETDPNRQPYGQFKFGRFGHATVMAPTYSTSQTGTWRVQSKSGETYTILLNDAKGSHQITVTMLGPDRIQLVIQGRSIDLRRM
jgi:phage FluMu protein Com